MVDVPRTSQKHTLYCSNLPDKIQKDELKKALYMLFTTYGSVLDVVALKTSKMRGQAHVCFSNTYASDRAMAALQGYEFFGKKMKIAYAKGKSDTLAKLDGTYKQPQSDAATAAQESAQQSIFSGPPGANTTMAGNLNSLPPPPGLAPPAANLAAIDAASPAEATTPASQGVKRTREESEDDSEAPMDMDDDDDEAPMDESEDD